jgi:hypothetical protein
MCHVEKINCVIRILLKYVLGENEYSIERRVGDHRPSTAHLENSSGQTGGRIYGVETVVGVNQAAPAVVMNSARIPKYCWVILGESYPCRTHIQGVEIKATSLAVCGVQFRGL